MLENKMEKLYKCSQCDYRARIPSQITYHERIHTNEKPYVCEFPGCDYSTRLPGTLVTHGKRHLDDKERSKRKKFECQQCDYRAENPSRLKIHAKVHSEERPLSCDVPGCDYKSRYKHSMTNHRKLVHPDEGTVWYECDKCDFRTKYEYVLRKRHSRLHAQVRPPKRFKCEFCNYDAHSRDKLEDHMRKHTGEKKQFLCDIPGCDFISSSQSSARRHKRLVHWEKIWYKCDQCSYQIWNKAGLTTHKKSHLEEKPFKCTFEGCEYRSKTKPCLDTHMNRHDYKPSAVSSSPQGSQKQHSELLTVKVARNLRRYPCTHPCCQFVAKERNDLSKHVQIHDPNRTKSIKCLLCPKLFFTEGSRRAHVRSHTNEKPLKCSYPRCDHRAYHPSDLKKHEHIHETEKPFICEYPGCGYSATCKNYLRKHSKTHRAERQPEFKCTLCPVGFYTRAGLKNHLFSHTTEKPFKCTVCGYSSIHSHLLDKHRCPENFKKTRKNDSGGRAKVVTPTAHLRDDGLYQCNRCDFTSKAKNSVTAHAGSAHTRKRNGNKPWGRQKKRTDCQ